MEKEVISFIGQQIVIRRRARQKRMGVIVHPSGEVKVTSNKSTSQREILKFLHSKESWLRQCLAEGEKWRRRYPPKQFRTGESYPFLGEKYRLKTQVGSLRLSFAGEEMIFTAPIAEDHWSDQQRLKLFHSLKRSYRQAAEKIMGKRLEALSEVMGLRPSGVQFRGQKSIWGSCSPENKISLNFKLIVAPPAVIDYVIIHELAHIPHKNHSAPFWRLVEKYTDDRHFSRDWLRENAYEADFLNKKSELAPLDGPL